MYSAVFIIILYSYVLFYCSSDFAVFIIILYNYLLFNCSMYSAVFFIYFEYLCYPTVIVYTKYEAV